MVKAYAKQDGIYCVLSAEEGDRVAESRSLGLTKAVYGNINID